MATSTFDLSTLNGDNGFVLNGIGVDDFFGRSVSSAGDVNGDGFGDIIIGALGADPNGNSRAGESYVVFGAATGFGSSFELSDLDGSNGFALNGIARDNEVLGESVSSAGDVNGDGFDDIVIGAPESDRNSDRNAGKSYVVFGAATGFDARFKLSDLDGSNGFVLNGIDSSDALGNSVSSAGDVNGDGFDDIIVGAFGADPNGSSRAGESYVVFGAATGFGSSFELSDLDGSNGFVLNGIDSSDASGNSVSSAGDVNGDGFDDIIVGASGADPNGSSGAGESYVVFGSSDFAPSFELSDLDGNNGFVLKGIDENDKSGSSVSSAGDVNGDGISDIIIGAYDGDGRPNPGGTGESYVVFGSATGFDSSLELSDLNGGNGFVLNGVARGDESGNSVSSAGDVNGDGIDDLVVGAFGADPNGNSRAGESYVVFGSANGFDASFELSNLNGSNGLVLNGIDSDDFSGFSVSDAGDVNGDGIDDIIIGAPFSLFSSNSNTGESYVVFGNDEAPVVDLNSRVNAIAGVVFNGIDNGDTSGNSVSSAGDVNGDGIDDIIIGAYQAAPNDNRDAGESYVVFGTTNGFDASLDLSSLDGSNGFVLNGIDVMDFSGRSASDAGDVNGDGIDDLIIGAFSANPDDNGGAGESYVVFGKANGFDTSFELSELNGSNGFVLDGITSNDNSGFSVSSAGDINSDGIDDLIIGSFGNSPNPNDVDSAGESYVVFGSATGFTERFKLSSLNGNNGFVLNGTNSGDLLGVSVSGAGDVNGDGIDDIIIGAASPFLSGDSGAEKSYVVFGSAAGFTTSLNLSDLNGSNGFVINGIDPGDLSGSSVSGAGDINGDGIDDLIIGARGADPNGQNFAGESYVVFGSANGFEASFELSGLDGSNGFTLNGVDSNGLSGSAVSNAGDVNGDGIDDLIVGAPLAQNADSNRLVGGSYVVFGSTNGFDANFELSSLDGSNGFVLNGINNLDFSGSAVSGAGDVNGDGIDDLIIGAPSASANSNGRAGQSYVVSGAIGIGSSGSLDLAGISGTNSAAFAGIDFTTAYDGNPTIIVGSNLDIDAGRSDVIRAAPLLQGATITLTNRPDGISESLFADITGTAIVADYDATTGVLTLSGTETVTNYEQVLRTLQYSNSETTPDTADRIIEVTVTSDWVTNNMSAIATSTVTFDVPDDDTLNGTTGDDTLIGGAAGDIIDGGNGDDILVGDEGDDALQGGNGNDTLVGGTGDDALQGGNGNDTLVGGTGDDALRGGNGDDTFVGGTGDDALRGGNGSDTLVGGAGNDLLRGGNGDDTLTGVDASVTAPGSAEEDTLIGGWGDDRFVLGDARNVFYFGNGSADFAEIRSFNLAENDLIQLNGSSSGYSLQNTAGDTRIFAGDGTTTDLVGVVTGVSFADFSSGFVFV